MTEQRVTPQEIIHVSGIREILAYNPDDDQDVKMGPSTEIIGPEGLKLSINISAVTQAKKVETPNEDAYKIVERDGTLLAGVFDGVTCRIKFSELDEETGARHASHLLRQAFGLGELNDLKSYALAMNELLHEDSSKLSGADIDHAGHLPSSTGTIMRLDPKNNKLEICHAGDSWIMVKYRNGKTELLSLDTNLIHDSKVLTMFEDIAKDKGITFRQAMEQYKDEHHEELLHISDAKMNPLDSKSVEGWDADYGTGAFNGQPGLSHYLIYDQIDLNNVDSILMGTDGIVPNYLSSNNEFNGQELFRIVETEGVEGLRDAARKSSADDPEWQNHRFKDNDDATAIYIKLN